MITERLIEFYRPLRIYLFGSAARTDSGPDSDLDFCVLLADETPEAVYRDRSIHQQFGDFIRPWTSFGCPLATSRHAQPMSWRRSLQQSSAKANSFMTPRELLHREAAKWLEQAAKDLTAAKALVVRCSTLPSPCVFLNLRLADKPASESRT